jgi:type IV secretory pathway VirD2 relaxase
MNSRDDDAFRVRPRVPRQPRGGGSDRFLTRVLTQIGRSGGEIRTRPRSGVRKGRARLGRGQVAARFAGTQLDARSRRVIVKARLIILKAAGSRAVAAHLRYLAREGVTRDGMPGPVYDAHTDAADPNALEGRGRGDRHQFRFIVSPEDTEQIQDLRQFTRELMERMEVDLETRLEWVAVDHWDTDNPHTHVVLRGVDQAGRDLVIDREYLSHGMRRRACELASEWLGPRTERELQASLQREVGEARWTNLDRELRARSREGVVDLREVPPDPTKLRQRAQLIGRLQRLERMGLVSKRDAGRWALRDDFEAVLRRLGERGDIVRTMQRAFGEQRRDLAIFDGRTAPAPILGRIAAKGVADELADTPYLVIDGLDGRGHYVTLSARTNLAELPVGGVVEVRAAGDRVADRTIAALARDGLYQADLHLLQLRAKADGTTDPDEIVAGHVRRLEALRRAGVVERITDRLWRVPEDLVARGKAYDVARSDGVDVVLHSHLPIERQIRAIGATWLDRQLAGEATAPMANQRFGASVQAALRAREAFLVEQGLAIRRDGVVHLARDLLRTLRARELDRTAKAIAAQTGLKHRPAEDGTPSSGVYRRSIMLASGRFAMLDDGLGFSLVPWRPVIEQRLGQSMTAVVRGDYVVWQFGRSRAV